MKHLTEVLTGIRPTGSLTVANYAGAVLPVINLQEQGLTPLVFVADIHALTDYEPSIVRQNQKGIVADYLALGVDPNKANIYLQSDVFGEVTILTTLLARHISVAELLRVPTLKDKLKASENPENANALLLLYPVLMAADILMNQTQKVPVGEDQIAHLEITRLLAKRFNTKYGDTFAVPEVLTIKSLRLMSLKGEGKMSKSNPAGALFLTDDAKTIATKIKGAETALAGVMTPRLESHITMAKCLASTEADQQLINNIIEQHLAGQNVMGQFKQEFTRIAQGFLGAFQERRASLTPEYIDSVLAKGALVAKHNAETTLQQVFKAFEK
jgi:tryptophanyl-tRNA synthetase